MEILSSGILSKEMRDRNALPEPSPCITRKMTPAECVKMGIDIRTSAQVMTPDDLTQEDAKTILDAGYGPATLQALYGFKSAGSLYPHLIKWGLHQKGAKPRPRVASTHRKKNPPTVDLKTFQEIVREGGANVQMEEREEKSNLDCDITETQFVPVSRGEFRAMITKEMETIQSLFLAKNESYGRDNDLFYNFRQSAMRILNEQGYAAMFTILMTLMDKHLVALANRGIQDKECAERLRDVIVYSLLGLAMWKEMNSNRTSGAI